VEKGGKEGMDRKGGRGAEGKRRERKEKEWRGKGGLDFVKIPASAHAC